jgi:hypothetical protein
MQLRNEWVRPKHLTAETRRKRPTKTAGSERHKANPAAKLHKGNCSAIQTKSKSGAAVQE